MESTDGYLYFFFHSLSQDRIATLGDLNVHAL